MVPKAGDTHILHVHARAKVTVLQAGVPWACVDLCAWHGHDLRCGEELAGMEDADREPESSSGMDTPPLVLDGKLKVES